MAMQLFRIMILLLLLNIAVAGCQTKKRQATDDDVKASVEKIMNIGEIEQVESIIADSTLMNAEGNMSWKKEGENMIRVKINEQYYLRMTTKEGTVTNITYRYDDKGE